jgi:outer membrane protein TolC
MIAFEKESSDAAKLNMDRAVDMYRLGSIAGIEFREIQRSYLSAEIRRLSALYQAKISEITLLYLAGKILQ